MIKKRAFTTLIILAIFMLGTFISLPYVEHTNTSTSLSDVVNLMSGGTISRFGFFALGISPFIMATIVMQLMTKASSRLNALQEQGVQGKTKIAQYTRILTLIMALFTSVSLLNNSQMQNTVGIRVTANQSQKIELIFLLCVGALFTTYLAERINKKGIGQGGSVLVATGIFMSLPKNFIELFKHRKADNFAFYASIIIAAYIGILIICILASKKEYKFAIQSKSNAARITAHQYPIKLLISSIMPVIAATTLIGLVSMIITIFDINVNLNLLNRMSLYGMGIYVLLLIIFSYVFNTLQIDGDEISKSFDDGQLYFVGISNLDTAKFLKKTVLSITTIGTVVLCFIVIASFIVEIIAYKKIGANISLTGVSLLIIVGVVSEMVYQIQGLRKYKEVA